MVSTAKGETMGSNLWVITYLDKRSDTAHSEIVVPGGPLHEKIQELAKKGEIRIDGQVKIDVPRCPRCGWQISGGYKQNWPNLSKPWPLSIICSKNEASAKCIMCGWETNEFKLVKKLLKP